MAMAGDTFTFTFPFDERQYAHAISAQMRLQFRSWQMIVILAVPVFYLVYSVLGTLAGARDPLDALITLLPWLVLIGFWGALLACLPKWTARRLQRRYAAFAGLQERSFTPSVVRSTSAGTRIEYAWTAVQRVLETDEFIYVYVTAAAAVFVPLAAIPIAELPAFRAFLRARLIDRPKTVSLRDGLPG